MVHVVKNILLRPGYIATALGAAFIAFAFVIWIPNLPLIANVFGNENVSWGDKIVFLWSLLGSITTNFTAPGAFATILIDFLFGVQFALTAYLLRERSLFMAGKSTAASAAGVGIGLLGIGCAACGSLIFTALLPAVFVSGILTLLPLRGIEFSILGAGVIAVSIFFTARYITRPAVCG